MNFEFSSDQAALLDAVDRIVARHADTPALAQRCQYSEALTQDLMDAGVFDAITIDELGPVAAAALVMAVARSPLCTEVVAAAFIAPCLAPVPPGPCAVLWGDEPVMPTRFLPVARSVIRIGTRGIDCAPLRATGEQVETLESLFAYPMGLLRDAAALDWQPLPGADPQALRAAWRIGIAAELVACLDAGLQAVLAHVRERRQFGRPLGSFQAIQHRLAECATRIEGARWLVFKAADSRQPLDILLAVAEAQRIATRVSYDLHQFMGAMGLTLEHPLHRWTYRSKLLRSQLGGADRHFIAAAAQAWPDAAQAHTTEVSL